MSWRRLMWTVSVLVLWVLSLVIVESAARKTRIGYRIHKLESKRGQLDERNLRLRCEVATLYDLDKAKEFARASGFGPIEPGDLELYTESSAE